MGHGVPAAVSNIARYTKFTMGCNASIPYPPTSPICIVYIHTTQYTDIVELHQQIPVSTDTIRNSIDPHRPPSPSHFESSTKWSVAKHSRNLRRSTNHAGFWSNGTAPMPATALDFGGITSHVEFSPWIHPFCFEFRLHVLGYVKKKSNKKN